MSRVILSINILMMYVIYQCFFGPGKRFVKVFIIISTDHCELACWSFNDYSLCTHLACWNIVTSSKVNENAVKDIGLSSSNK